MILFKLYSIIVKQKLSISGCSPLRSQSPRRIRKVFSSPQRRSDRSVFAALLFSSPPRFPQRLSPAGLLLLRKTSLLPPSSFPRSSPPRLLVSSFPRLFLFRIKPIPPIYPLPYLIRAGNGHKYVFDEKARFKMTNQIGSRFQSKTEIGLKN